MRIVRILTIAAFVGIGAAGITARGQVNPYPPPASQGGASGRNPNGISGQQQSIGPTDIPPRIASEQARAGNIERQKQLEADTAKLLSLATELKEQVGKTNQNVMSLDVIKKADEIEKLAKNVKERMKGAR
jgi:hypothetical protein